MAGQTIVTTAKFVATEEGVARTAAALEKMRQEALKAAGAMPTFSKSTQAALAQIAKEQENARKMVEAARSAMMDKAGAKEITLQFEQNARALQRVNEEARKLTGAIDPMARKMAELAQQQEKLNQLAEVGALSWEEHGRLSAINSQNMSKFGKAANDAGERVKLTSDQVRNLGFQLNDAATMLASGSSPFQVLATQSGQVIQALGDGPGGVRGSLMAMFDTAKAGAISAATALGPIGIGLGVITAGIGAFALATRNSIPDANAALKAHAEILQRVAQQYEGVQEVLDEIGQRANIGINIELGANQEDKIKAFRAQVKEVEREFAGAGGFLGRAAFGGVESSAIPSLAKFGPIADQVDDLRAKFREANPDIAALSNEVVSFNQRLSDAYKTAGDDTEMKRAIEAAREFIKPLLENAVALDQAAAAANGAAQATARYRSAMDDLRSLTPDLRSQAQQINDAFSQAFANAQADGDGMVAQFRQQKALAADAAGAFDMLNAARAEGASIGLGEEAKAVAAVEQEYAKLRVQYADNEKALIALDQWRQQSIDNAGRQAVFDRDQEAAQEAAAAAKRATDEAQRYAEATRSRIAGLDQSVAGQRLEIELLSKSEGEAQALRFEFQALSAAKQAAASAGQVVSDDEIAAIRRAAGEVGALAAQFKAMQEAQEQAQRLAETFDDIAFERSIIGLSDAEQRVRETIHGLGIDYGSFDGQRLAGEMRYNDALRQTQDEMRKTGEIAEDAFGGLIDALTQGGDLMQNLMGFAADLGRQFAAMGAQKLFGNLFGGGQAANDNFAGGLFSGSMPAASPSYAAAPVMSAGAASYGAVASAPMRALNENLTKVGRSALDVAKQFNGLNERADSRVLDSFLRTSGNWKNLSAADTAWCAAFANAAIVQSGGKGTGSNLASSFMGWGQGTNAPKVGDIVVLKPQARGASGHVGFVAGFGDGTVQVFGGNQSSGANTKSFGLNQVRGYRTAGTPAAARSATETYAETRIVQRGVSEGMRDFTRQWGGTPSADAQAAMANGSFDGFSHNGAAGGRGLFSQNGLNVLGAGFGAFGAGYQSGSPFSGGLSGALGGYQAGPAISSMLGVGGMAGSIIGGVGGAALGILGGILGARKQRAEAHKRAAEQWDQMKPQYEAFKQSLSGEGQGQIREWITGAQGQLSSFMKVGGAAWKNGTGNSSQEFWNTGTKMWDRFYEMTDEFREGFEAMVEDLSSGEGLGGAFAKGRAATKDLKTQIEGMIDDVSIAFGSDDIGVPVADFYSEASKTWEEARDKAIERAKAAAGEYALSLLYTAESSSDVEKALDGFRGTAAGLQTILEDLGWTAEDAAADISDRLTQAIADMGKTFVESFQSQINDLSGVGYLNDAADLIKARDTAMNDAALLGVDPEIVSRWFKLASQDLVDGSELVGSAFDDLVKAFPELSGVVHQFTGASRTAAEAARAAQASALASYEASKSQLESVYSAVLSYRDGVRSFLDDMKLGDNSTLSQKDQVAEARRVYEEMLAKANGGDKEAMAGLTGAAQDYLSEAKDYFASSADYTAIFDSVNASLKSADVKATSQIDLMKSQAAWLEDISGNTADVAKALADFVEAQKGLNANRSWGVMADQNKAIWSDLNAKGINYSGNFGGGQFLDWVASQTPSMQAIIQPVIDKWRAAYAPKGFSSGGWTGPAATNAVAGVVHGQEFVAHAEATRRWRPQLEAMNAGAVRLPNVAPVQMPSVQPMGGDNRALLAELRESNRLLRQQIATMGQGLAQNVQATERGNRATEDMAMTARRDVIRERAA